MKSKGLRVTGLALTVLLVAGLGIVGHALAQETIKFGAIYDFAGGCHMVLGICHDRYQNGG